ncbi:MAG: flagellar hook-associated protein FlgK [Alphaproteobacteria bacterium]|nr:flagellar hook-associated protein FlgK [Alphaproteobacteria bacterium]
MSINIILSNAVSGLNTSQAALREIANNVSNVNTPGYARRVVEQQTRTIGGESAGVEIAEIRRVVDSYLQRQVYSASGDAGKYQEMTRLHDKLQALLGRPDEQTSIASRIDSAFSAIAELVVDPASTVSRSNYLFALESMASTVTRLADEVQGLRQEADQLIEDKVTRANAIIQRIDEINPMIASQEVTGGSVAGLRDELDQAVAELSEILDVRIEPQSNGTVNVVTSNGFVLVGGGHVQLSYATPTSVSAGSDLGSIEARRVTSGGVPSSAPPQALEPNLISGALSGLIEMRDRDLPAIAQSLGELAGALTDSINRIHNENAAVPAPASLSGRNTGLLTTDAHGFTGTAQFFVTDSGGSIVRRVDMDFTAGTYSVNGGASVGFGGTVGAMVGALNTALGASASASFANGTLSLSASGSGTGVTVLQDTASPADRGGRGFSHFFGLNDALRAYRPAILDTGLTAGDAHGFPGSGQIAMRAVGADGTVLGSNSLTISGTTIGDLVTALNDPTSGFGSFASFSLDSDGRLTATATGGASVRLEVVSDSTLRGDTALSVSTLFGLGTAAGPERARDLGLVPSLRNTPSALALARPAVDASMMPGARLLAPGDNRGATALQGLLSTKVAFAAAGTLGATTETVSSYAARFLSGISNLAARAEDMTSDAMKLSEAVSLRRDEVQGVNLDEELASLLVYQQAYNASARMIQAAQELFDTLTQIV